MGGPLVLERGPPGPLVLERGPPGPLVLERGPPGPLMASRSMMRTWTSAPHDRSQGLARSGLPATLRLPRDRTIRHLSFGRQPAAQPDRAAPLDAGRNAAGRSRTRRGIGRVLVAQCRNRSVDPREPAALRRTALSAACVVHHAEPRACSG